MSGECEDCGHHCLECTCNFEYFLNHYYGWNGGDNPVPGKRVMVVLRSVESIYSNVSVPSEVLEWGHEGSEDDIVAFKIEGVIH